MSVIFAHILKHRVFSGFALSFIMEVLRVLITVGQMTKEEKENPGASEPKDVSNVEAGEVHADVEGATERLCRKRISHTHTMGRTCIFLTPLITSAAMTIFSISELAQKGWTAMYGKEFFFVLPFFLVNFGGKR